MLITKHALRVLRGEDINKSEITEERDFRNRRRFIREAALGTGALIAAGPLQRLSAAVRPGLGTWRGEDEELTPYEDVTTYNNFYEFGTGKEDPAENAHTLQTRPWTVQVDGEVNKPKVFDIEEILARFPAEERVYRLRCVEAWSMVIPWRGFQLSRLLEAVETTSMARFVKFTTLHDSQQMPGQRRPILPWPYVEGLRMDEAMHPLTILATGLYGRELPNQNGAPLRLVVPWKYGFKSIKSIVRIQLVREQPANTWAVTAPNEYGFYANVNPEVDHPRWSQARERRIGKFFKQKTLMFNGYGEQVAHLYRGMDLAKHF